jgi:serine/threonine-protein kinase
MIAPTKIGKYEIRRQIGRGAMGVVYEAFDPVIERRVAIKTLRLEIFDPSQTTDVRTRFKREAQSAGQLAHPHIVTVYAYGDHEGTPYIVMEVLAGNELSQILHRGARLPLSEVVRLMAQLLGALTYAHERKVVHRDIKPGNIFILDDGSVKVVDFGLAHVEASNLTDTGALLGTPAYMSPEQFLALPVDERSDIFSAGVILYELLTGEKPFTGSVASIMQKVLRQEPMEPSVLNPMISAAWDAVIKRAMAKKQDARFQSARQFSETIRQVFDKGALNLSVEVTLTGSKGADFGGDTLRFTADKKPVPQKQRPIPPEPTHAEIAPAKSSSKTGLAIAVTAIVLAIGFAGIYLTQRSKPDQSRFVDVDKPASEAKGFVDPDEVAAEAKLAADKAAADAKADVDKSAHEAKVAKDLAAREGVAEAKKAALVRKAAESAQAEKELRARVAAEVARLEKLRTEKAEAERNATETARLERLRTEKAEADRIEAERASAARRNVRYMTANECRNRGGRIEASGDDATLISGRLVTCHL